MSSDPKKDNGQWTTPPKTDESWPSHNLKLITVDKDKVRGYQVLHTDKQEARKILIQKINKLINETYDNYRFQIPEHTTDVIAAILDRTNLELAGMMMFLRNNIRGVEYGEFGVSIVNKNYRGLGIQSMCRKALEMSIFDSFDQNIPLYAFPRAFSANSQMQVYAVKLPDENNNVVSVGSCGGFLIYYFLEKDFNGEYILENDMAFTAWPNFGKIVEKNIFLPPIALEKDFHIFNQKYRADTVPIYAFPYIQRNGEFNLSIVDNLNADQHNLLAQIYPENNYSEKEWESLAHYISVIGFDNDEKKFKKSRNNRFLYSDPDSPNNLTRSIHIEKLWSFDFLYDIDRTMKCITVCVQMSDFPDEITQIANLALVDILLHSNFVPTAQFDASYNRKRTRICYFSRWQGVHIESRYEVLIPYQKYFEILNHDTQVQAHGWPKLVNIVDPDSVTGMRNNNAILQENVFTMEYHFHGIAKGTDSYLNISQQKKIRFPLAQTPFNNIVKAYLENTNRIAYITFTNETNILTKHLIEDFETIIGLTPLFMEQFHLEQRKSVVISFRLHENVVRIRFELNVDGVKANGD